MIANTCPTVLRRLLGWTMLLAYMAGIQGLAPLAFAALQHGHEVSFSSDHGDWHLVLSHPDHGDSVEENAVHPAGEHGFEVTNDDGGSDHHHGPAHVFCFASENSDALGAVGLSAPKVYLCAVLVEKCAAPEFRIYPVPVYFECVAARPPPGKPAWLVCLSTTVLIV